MRELVIALSDLYLAEEPDASLLTLGPGSVAGLEQLARFGTRRPLPVGWRAWVAGWLGREDLAALAPARLAALALDAGPVAAGTAWFASPVHLHAGLARVHLPADALLRLAPEEAAQLTRDFAAEFGAAGYALAAPRAGSELLLRTPRPWQVRSREPARSLGAELPVDLAVGPDAPALRRLAAELEMWLHRLPLNAQRVARGQRPITGLWLWGGEGEAAEPARAGHTLPGAWGDDAYIGAVWHLLGGRMQGLPAAAGQLLAEGHERGIIVLQLGAEPAGAAAGAPLAQLDAQWLRPACAALRRGALARLTLLANDRALTLERRGLLRFWRRRRPGLSGLQ